MSTLSGLDPPLSWRHFETLMMIPPPSRVEDPVIEHIRRPPSGATTDTHGADAVT